MKKINVVLVTSLLLSSAISIVHAGEAERQAVRHCAMSGVQSPYEMAVCVGFQVTKNELDNCLQGRDCFGPNNTMRIHVNNAWRDITRGPGPNNDLTGQNGWTQTTIRNAEHDLRYGPGPNNEFCKIGLC